MEIPTACVQLPLECKDPNACPVKLGICIAYFVVAGSQDLYAYFAPKDDHRLIAKIGMEDCGGLSKMSSNVKGCFRKYVGEAIERTKSLPSYGQFLNRFEACFANRPMLTCGDWFTRTDVF